MSKLSSRISFPVILAGVFAITIFMALNYQNTNITFYITLLLLTLFTFFFGFAIGQNLSSPIKQLLEKAREISQGNVSGRIYLETKDELSELARTLNQIAEELELKTGESKKAEEIADIKVRARTKSLEETINNLDQKVKNRTIELERLMQEAKQLKQQAQANEAELNKLRGK